MMATIAKAILNKINLILLLGLCLGFSSTLYGAQKNDAPPKKKQKISTKPVSDAATLGWRCTSVEDCEAVLCVMLCLDYWYKAHNNPGLKSIFTYLSSANHYKHVISAYHHVLETHLSTPNSHANYKYISQKITQTLACNFTACTCYTRNQRKRGQEDKVDKDNDREFIFLRDLLDTIHAYLVHGYDSGHRYLNKGMEKIGTGSDNAAMDGNKEATDKVFFDEALKNLQQWQKKIKKQQRNLDRGQVFNTTKSTVNKADIFGFGVRLYYWYYYKGNNDPDWDDEEYKGTNYNPGYRQKDLYVRGTYSSFKDEILAKSIPISIWAQKLYEAKMLLHHSETLRSIKVLPKEAYETNLALKYGFAEKDGMQEVHVLAILFYTSCSTLCRELRESCRYLSASEQIKDVINRNAKWYYFSMLLREVVEVFGKQIGRNHETYREHKGSFYHGLRSLHLSSLCVHFYGPLSTSKQLEVALLFSDDNDGLVLEIKEGGGFYDKTLRLFNVNLLSCFAAEDERLFIGGEFPVQIASVRLLKSKINTKLLMHTLFVIHQMIRGEYLLEDEITRLDIEIVKKLLSNTNDFPSVIQKIWKAFSNKQENIKIDIGYMHKYYRLFAPLLLSSDPKYKNLLMLNRLVKIFPNTAQILCVSTDNVNGGWDSKDYSPSIVCGTFIEGLRDRLNKIGQHKSSKLRKVIIRIYSNEIKEDCEEYAPQFDKLGWTIKKESYDSYHVSTEKNNQICVIKKQ